MILDNSSSSICCEHNFVSLVWVGEAGRFPGDPDMSEVEYQCNAMGGISWRWKDNEILWRSSANALMASKAFVIEPGLPQFIHFSLILPGPQITWKWTMHTDKLTTKCHICLHTWKQGGLMCGIWDWQSTIVTQSGHCPLFWPLFLHDGFPKPQNLPKRKAWLGSL